jgi:hypothetical protein
VNPLDYLREVIRHNGLRSCWHVVLGVLVLGLICWGLVAAFGG